MRLRAFANYGWRSVSLQFSLFLGFPFYGTALRLDATAVGQDECHRLIHMVAIALEHDPVRVPAAERHRHVKLVVQNF